MSDHDQSAEIERMIAAEPDPRVRVQLMMMHKLTSAVAEIGVSVADLDNKFSCHARDEATLLNQVKGGWKVAIWVFGIAQAVVVYAYLSMSGDVKELSEARHSDIAQHENFNVRLEVVEQELKARK